MVGEREGKERELRLWRGIVRVELLTIVIRDQILQLSGRVDGKLYFFIIIKCLLRKIKNIAVSGFRFQMACCKVVWAVALLGCLDISSGQVQVSTYSKFENTFCVYSLNLELYDYILL